MVVNWDLLKQLYLKSDQASQFHSLALNLTRIQILTQDRMDGPIAKHLIRESQFFIRPIHKFTSVTVTGFQKI
jgi:hypothetical protein